jgi:hypothetical protein
MRRDNDVVYFVNEFQRQGAYGVQWIQQRRDWNDRMSKIAVVIPACLQAPRIFDQFRANLRTIRHDSIRRLIVVCNRLTLMKDQALEAFLSLDVPYPVQVIHDKERSVAGAWNHGIDLAMQAGIEQFLITAVDVALLPDTIERLLTFGDTHLEVDIWSSAGNDVLRGCREEAVHRCDFSCFMLRKSTVERHGWFDRHYKPAYFEDNDYVTRVVLGGGEPKQIVLARHRHDRSLTIKLDKEMAHHVHHWFGQNSARFRAKWKVSTNDYARIRVACFQTPYDSGKPLSWWPEQERTGYTPTGGIHE